jgi:PEGA domain
MDFSMKRLILLSMLLLALGLVRSTVAQENEKVTSTSEKARVFVTDSQSWEMSGAEGGSSAGFGGAVAGGARPQTAEIIKTFGERCPQVLINNIQTKADYVVVLDHEGGKGYLRHRNKVVVFGRVNGDSIVSKSTLSLGGSVQTACEAIDKDWAAHGSDIRAAALAAQNKSVTTQAPAAMTSAQVATSAKISVVSIPDGADIEVDGSFVGNTPSDIDVTAGEHTISVQKTGSKSWQRKLKVSNGSSIHLKAELEKNGKVGVTADLEAEATQSPAVVATETKKEPDPPKQGSQTAASAAGGVPISAGPGENTGTIIVTSEPTGAEIYLDNSPAGIAPVTLKLKPGNHSIRAFKKGYQNWLRAVTLEAGQNLPLTVAMQKLNY